RSIESRTTADGSNQVVLMAPADGAPVSLCCSKGINFFRRHSVEAPQVGASVDLRTPARAGSSATLVLAHPCAIALTAFRLGAVTGVHQRLHLDLARTRCRALRPLLRLAFGARFACLSATLAPAFSATLALSRFGALAVRQIRSVACVLDRNGFAVTISLIRHGQLPCRRTVTHVQTSRTVVKDSDDS